MSTFEELAGLPGSGPWPEQFSATGRGTHREGFVVKFVPARGASWIGNFQPGLTSLHGVYRHPNRHHLLVVSGGQGGNTATTNAFPSPYGVIVTLRGGGTFIL